MVWEKQIVEQYGEEDIYRQLAEEAAELCQASLKRVRSMRRETPVTEKEAHARLLEEIADVYVMLGILKLEMLSEQDIKQINDTYQAKKDRMIDRMLEGECLDSDGR